MLYFTEQVVVQVPQPPVRDITYNSIKITIGKNRQILLFERKKTI